MASGMLKMNSNSVTTSLSLSLAVILALPLPSLCTEFLPVSLALLLHMGRWLPATLEKINPTHRVGKMFFFQNLQDNREEYSDWQVWVTC